MWCLGFTGGWVTVGIGGWLMPGGEISAQRTVSYRRPAGRCGDRGGLAGIRGMPPCPQVVTGRS